MRLVFITPEYVTEKYFAAGLANYLGRLCPLLAQRGHEVFVIVRAEKKSPPFTHNGVTILRVAPSRTTQRILNAITLRRQPEAAKDIAFSVSARQVVNFLHRQRRLTYVQCSNVRAVGIAFLLPGRPYAAATRMSSHRPLWNELAMVRQTKSAGVRYKLEALQVRRFPHVYGPSKYLAAIIEKECRRKVDVLPTTFYLEPCVEDASVYEKHLKGLPYLLYFSRLQKHKGVDVLARALPTILGGNSGLRAVFVGNDWADRETGSMRSSVREWAGDCADRVIFLDDMRHEQLYPVIRHAEAVVFPSRIDNLPNACMEAMALGKPVIASSGASFEELFDDGISGYLFRNGDHEDLARVATEVLRSADRSRVGEAARERISALHPDRTVPLVEKYITERVRARSGGRRE
ncbi:MAG: glycosyltransferase family 4 protein [SAR202 cluster bacterium]|nr:glycosyltransferase family 4 protein [SAR202 cluster bacterium]